MSNKQNDHYNEAIGEFKMKIYQKPFEDCQDSFFYEGLIAENGKFRLLAVGDIRVAFPDEDFYRKDSQALDEALDRNYTDKDLINLEFENNNWFEIVGEENDFGDIYDTYDEALKALEATK